jgi:RNase P/RNase MRP subunit p29
MNKKTLARDELIGLPVKVNQCKDPSWVKRAGIIIDETKNTFLIRIDDKNKRIAKNIATFEFKQNREGIKINGLKIAYKPEDRIKKAR